MELFYAGHGFVGETDCCVCFGSGSLPAFVVSAYDRGVSVCVSESDSTRIYFHSDTIGLDGVP